MNKRDIDLLINQVASEIESRIPVVTGNLLRNTEIIKTGNSQGVIAKVVLNTEYAAFVNYGYKTHPNSIKLANDYMFVERAIKQALRLYMAKYGGIVK